MSNASTSTPALQVADLHHSFKQHHALKGVTFQVERGAIHGFVGPNGAGKTTTLKIICTLLPPQRGLVHVFGMDIVHQQRAVRQKLGFMPDHFSMYKQMTLQEYLDFFAAAYGLPFRRRTQIISDVLALTDMDGRRHEMITSLSRGMQQRLSLARVLINDPELLLLDEPASGLDPRARIELMEILRELARMGKTIFISSHILSELAELCDSVTIIDRGVIKFSGPIQALLRHEGDTDRYVLALDGEPATHEPAIEALKALPGVREVIAENGKPQWAVVFQTAEVNTSAILGAVLGAGGLVTMFRRSERHLNQAFMDLTDPGVRDTIELEYADPADAAKGAGA